IGDGALEMTVRTFNRAVLMGDPGVIAGRGHAVMDTQLLIALRQILARRTTQVPEGGGQAVAAMFARDTAERPQRILQSLSQCDEALATEHHVGMFEPRICEPEMIEP